MTDVTQYIINIDTNLADVANQVKSLESNLSGLYKKFVDVADVIGEIEKKAGKAGDTIVNLNSSLNTVVGKGGSISGSPRSKQYKAMADAVIDDTKAQTGYTKAQTDLINEQVKNFGQTLVNMTTKINAYAESVSKQVDKATKTAHMQADTELKKAAAYYKTIQAQVLQNSGQSRFTGGLSGGLAYGLSGMSQRFRGQQGLVGLASRVGERLGENQDSWFGKTFGKGGKINNAFGGLLAKGTVDGLGINAGALAVGGFATAIGAAAVAVKEFRKATLDAYGSMEKLSVNLEVVYGSKTQSNQAFNEIQQYATKSPFGVAQTTEMAVLLKQSGVYASELQETLEMIGDVSSGNEEKMKRIANNYAQIQAIGHASMLDMRQFAYAGLPIYEEVAKTMDTTQNALRSKISEGQVTAEIIEETFKRMTGEGGTFYRAVNKGSQTRAARETNLEDIKNIALSNYGDWLWNNNRNGTSIAQGWLGLKENFWSVFGDIGKSLAVDQKNTMALQDRAYLNSLKETYKAALKDNNQPLANALHKEIVEARSNGRDEDSMIAAFSDALVEKLNLNKKTVVSDEEYNVLESRWREAHSKGFQPLDATASSAEQEAQEAARNEAIYLEGILKELVKQSEIDEKILRVENSNESYKAYAYYSVQDNKWVRSIVDSTNKLAGGANSLASLTAKYEEEYKNSKEGKEEAKKKEETDYEAYKQRFKSFENVFDTTTRRFKIEGEGVNKNSILDAINSGLLTSKEIKLTQGSLTDDEYMNEMKSLKENLKNTMTQLTTNFGVSTSDEVFTKLQEIFGLAVQLNYKNDTNNQNQLVKSVNELKNYLPTIDKDIAKIVQTSFETYNDMPTMGRRGTESGNGKEKDLFIPLWKRIVANATGWDASKIGGGADFFKNEQTGYNRYMQRQVVGGGVQGLVKAGLGSQELLSMMRFQGDKDNKQGVRQIDWGKTESEMLRYALSMEGGTKKSAMALEGLSSAIESQVSTLQKLTADMFTVGEDWGTINNDIKGAYSVAQGLGVENIFDSAFGASAPKSSDYDLQFDRGSGELSVFDSKTGKLIGSVEELKKSTDKNNASLNKFVDGIKVDSILKELDLSRKQMETLSDTVKVANSIAQQSLSWQQQANQTWAKSVGGSVGALGALRSATARTEGGSALTTKVEALLGQYGGLSLRDMRSMNVDANFLRANGGGVLPDSVHLDIAKEIFDNPEYKDLKKTYQGMLASLTYSSTGGEIPYDETFSWAETASFEEFNKAIEEAGESVEDFYRRVNSNQVFTADLPLSKTTYPMDSLSKEAKGYLSEFLSSMASNISGIDVNNWDAKSMQAVSDKIGGGMIDDGKAESIRAAALSFQSAGTNFQSQMEALRGVFEAFGVPFQDLIDKASTLAEKAEAAKYNDMASGYLSDTYAGGFWDMAKKNAYVQSGNSLGEQNLMNAYGLSGSFSKFSSAMTANAMANPAQYSNLVNGYQKAATDTLMSSLGEQGWDTEDLEVVKNSINEMFASGNLEDAKDYMDGLLGEGAWDKAAEGVNKYAMSLEDISSRLSDLGSNLGNVMEQFAGQAVSSTFETWGKSLAEGADSSKSLMENFRQLGAGLMSNLGMMITEAGLSMAIHATSPAEVWAGLAIAAAGAGASFLGGMLSADKDDDDETEDKFKKLQQIKEDLSDLLKQAREDAIYYENTLRHKNALSANDNLTTTKVNDAIITPSGNVISTHPDDYLIATKTPQTLIGGSGSPTINFSVIDKSTGIKVTSQKSTYNEDDNSIDFEAIIESKVQEIIASPKGDDAFSAREARINGRRVIA